MYDNQSRGISYTAGFFMLIAFTAAGLVLAGVISAPVWRLMTGLDILQMKEQYGNPAYANAMKVLQSINAVVGFFIPAVVAAALINRQPMRLLGFSNRIKSEQVGLVLLIIGSSLIVSTSLSYFNTHIPIPDNWRISFNKLEENYNKQVEAIIHLKTGTDYIIALVVMGFLPALCEETLFRGGLQNFLSRGTKMPWLSIVIVSILFSLAHLSFFGFLARFFLGVVLGAIYHYSGKLWLSILGHFLNNALALTVLFVYTQKGRPLQDAMKNDTSNNPWAPWGIIILLVVISLFILFKKVSAANRRLV